MLTAMNDAQKAESVRAFKEAIEKANGQMPLAMVIGMSQPTVHRISIGARPIEAQEAARIEKEYGIPRYRLRPDLYDAPKRRRSQKKANGK